MALTKFGDWDLVLNLTKHMEEDVMRANRIALAQLAARAEAIAVKHLRNQDLKWRPLDQRYLEYKTGKNLSDKILIATSTYFQSITSMVKGDVSFAGVTRKVKEQSGQFVADIARVHEYGSVKRNIPARPLWQPVYKEMRNYLMKEQLFAAETIRQWSKRTHGKGRI